MGGPGRELVQWLWSKLLQSELQTFMEYRNGTRMKKDANKPGPSGVSHNEAYSLPSTWGGKDLLIPVDIATVDELTTKLGGDTFLDFVPSQFSTRAQTVYESLSPAKLSFDNVWEIFASMKVRLLLGR